MVARLVSFCTDERALADQRRADDAVDRRAHGGVVEIEFGAREFGLAALDLGMGLALGRDRLLVLGFGRGALAGERGDAVRLLRGLHQHGLGLGDRRLGGHHLDLERTRIDAVERIARLHLAALTEQALDDDAGDARPHVGDARRRDAARQLAHHGARLRLDDDDADVRIDGLGSGDRRTDSSQPASSGVKAASIIATHADRARSPDMKLSAPMLLKLKSCSARARSGRFHAADAVKNRRYLLRRNALSRAAQCHTTLSC